MTPPSQPTSPASSRPASLAASPAPSPSSAGPTATDAPPPAPEVPALSVKELVEIGVLIGVALAVRALAAALLGGGAPFGPDGTGAEAAVVLGGHLYPLHPALIGLFGSARALSVVSSALTAGLLGLYGRRLGLGAAGGWIAAFFPLMVYTGALSAGDAPALLFVVAGATLSTAGRTVGPLLGGALAMASVMVKPVALPALVLLLPRPRALLGALAAAPLCAGWLAPLLQPKPQGGLLGSWWVSHGGVPPGGVYGWARWLRGGVDALLGAPGWTLWPVGGLATVAAMAPRLRSGVDAGLRARVAGFALMPAIILVAAMFGDRLEPRYLTAALAAALPWLGAAWPRGLEGLMLWPTAALVTQVAAYRAEADPEAGVPVVEVVPWPEVDARALFDESSTDGASTLRAQALKLAETLPFGDTVTVERRPHGREGELVWPLLALRPDLHVRRR